MKKIIRVCVVLLLMAGITACGFKPLGTTSVKEQPEPRYFLTVASDEVYTIFVSSAESSGGCCNAEEEMFTMGDEVWLEAIDGFDDLRGVTIKALGEEDKLIWSIEIPDTDEYAGKTEIKDGKWKIAKR